MSTREEFESVRTALAEGEDFSDIVKRHSEPENAREDDRSALYLTFQEFGEIAGDVFALKMNQVSEPIPTDDGGCLIVQFVDERPGRQQSLAEASATIREKIRNERHTETWRRFLTNLRVQAKLELNDTLLEKEAKIFNPSQAIEVYGLRKAYPPQK